MGPGPGQSVGRSLVRRVVEGHGALVARAAEWTRLATDLTLWVVMDGTCVCVYHVYVGVRVCVRVCTCVSVFIYR